jgi:hypothetical protein
LLLLIQDVLQMRSQHIEDRLDLLAGALEAGNHAGNVHEALEVLIASSMLRTLDGTDDRIKKAHGNRSLLGDS